MSCKFSIDDLDSDSISSIPTDLEIEMKNRYQSIFAKKKYLILYGLNNNIISLPFYYTYKLFKKKPNRHITYPTTKCKFVGKLRPKQIEVRNEIMRLFNTYGCAFLAAHPGFGKTILTQNKN